MIRLFIFTHHHQTSSILNAQISTLNLPQVPRRSPLDQRKEGNVMRQCIRVLKSTSTGLRCVSIALFPLILHSQGPSFYMPVSILFLVILSPTLASGSRVFKNVQIYSCSNPIHDPRFSSDSYCLTVHIHGLFRLSSLLTMLSSDSQLDEKLRTYINFFFLSQAQSLESRRRVLNQDTSLHANRLARQPRFFEIFEEDKMGSNPL